ncbi:MAG: hypothetical protein ACJA0H_002045 [Francisellaceae bacterium]|jgi:hypothetical protein
MSKKLKIFLWIIIVMIFIGTASLYTVLRLSRPGGALDISKISVLQNFVAYSVA